MPQRFARTAVLALWAAALPAAAFAADPKATLGLRLGWNRTASGVRSVSGALWARF